MDMLRAARERLDAITERGESRWERGQGSRGAAEDALGVSRRQASRGAQS